MRHAWLAVLMVAALPAIAPAVTVAADRPAAQALPRAASPAEVGM